MEEGKYCQVGKKIWERKTEILSTSVLFFSLPGLSFPCWRRPGCSPSLLQLGDLPSGGQWRISTCPVVECVLLRVWTHRRKADMLCVVSWATTVIRSTRSVGSFMVHSLRWGHHKRWEGAAWPSPAQLTSIPYYFSTSTFWIRGASKGIHNSMKGSWMEAPSSSRATKFSLPTSCTSCLPQSPLQCRRSHGGVTWPLVINVGLFMPLPYCLLKDPKRE